MEIFLKDFDAALKRLHDGRLDELVYHFVECPECHNRILIDKTFARIDSQATNIIAMVIIPLKLPSFNEYVNACRSNAYKGAKMKKQTDEDIMWFINKLPKFEKPIEIHFHWIEGNQKRDYDNISAGKKFILDALVKAGKLKDDNRNFVKGHSDSFEYQKGVWKVILEIKECCDET